MKGNISRKSFKLTGYTIVFIMFLLVFIYSGFPVDSLKMRIISEIRKSSPYNVEIGNMHFPGSTHVGFQDVKIADGNKTVSFDTVLLKPGISDLISDDISVPFVARGLGGELTGKVSLSRKQRSLNAFDVKLKGLDAKSLTSIFNTDSKNLNLAGEIDGTLNVDLKKTGSRYTATGEYNFNSEDFTISDVKIESFSLPAYRNLKTDLRGTFDNKQTKIEKLNFRNEDFELSFFGTMPPVWQLSNGGKLDLFLNLNLYSNEAKLSFLKAFLSPRGDGTHAAKILGTLSNPRLVKDTKYEF